MPGCGAVLADFRPRTLAKAGTAASPDNARGRGAPDHVASPSRPLPRVPGEGRACRSCVPPLPTPAAAPPPLGGPQRPASLFFQPPEELDPVPAAGPESSVRPASARRARCLRGCGPRRPARVSAGFPTRPAGRGLARLLDPGVPRRGAASHPHAGEARGAGSPCGEREPGPARRRPGSRRGRPTGSEEEAPNAGAPQSDRTQAAAARATCPREPDRFTRTPEDRVPTTPWGAMAMLRLPRWGPSTYGRTRHAAVPCS